MPLCLDLSERWDVCTHDRLWSERFPWDAHRPFQIAQVQCIIVGAQPPAILAAEPPVVSNVN